MVDKERVCCLCGDVGFPHKLFRCSRCRFRFQHSYCSNYYCGEAKEKDNICDWCHSEAGKNPSSSSSSPTSIRHGVSFKRSSSSSSEPYHHLIRSEYNASGERIKMMHPPYHHHHDHHDNHDSTTNESPKPSKNSGPSPNPSPRVPSPRPNGHRRYKLLKDVMC